MFKCKNSDFVVLLQAEDYEYLKPIENDMPTNLKRTVTIIYYQENALELLHEVHVFNQNEHGRVVIPSSFKVDKSIIAVCEGKIDILNKIGDRILSVGKTA